jgi:hypothetical protein
MKSLLPDEAKHLEVDAPEPPSSSQKLVNLFCGLPVPQDESEWQRREIYLRLIRRRIRLPK